MVEEKELVSPISLRFNFEGSLASKESTQVVEKGHSLFPTLENAFYMGAKNEYDLTHDELGVKKSFNPQVTLSRVFEDPHAKNKKDEPLQWRNAYDAGVMYVRATNEVQLVRLIEFIGKKGRER